ncbi:hypothetical protein FDX05_07115, partial [Citrobacter sp. wls715]
MRKNSTNAPYGASLLCGGIVTKTFAQRSRIFLFPSIPLFHLYMMRDKTRWLAKEILIFVDNSVRKWV